MREKLNIGILIGDEQIPAWMFYMLIKINESPSCNLVLIAELNFDHEYQKTTGHFAYDIYNKWDSVKYKQEPNAFELKKINSLLDQVEPEPHYIRLNSINQIKEKRELFLSYSIDVLINLVSVQLDAYLQNISKYGIWSYHFGDFKHNLGDLPNFWEVIQKWPETGVSVLMRSNENMKTYVLVTSTSLTDNLSVERGKNSYYWKSSSLIPRKLDELYNEGEIPFFEKVYGTNKHPQFYCKPYYTFPCNSEMIFIMVKFQLNRFLNALKSLVYFDQWILLFKLEPTAEIATQFFEFKKIIPPKDRFWADPHVIYKDNKYYIFIEELIYSENKGFISVMEMDEQGNINKPVKIIEKSYHLSYPFVFEDNGEYYMVPESKENKDIQLFKCTSFPYEWELKKVLMNDVLAADTTILFRNKKYWLFTNMVENNGGSSYDELFLFYSEELVSDKWIPHPKNPIVSDVKNARPAGKLFYFNESLYRPAQNCSGHYGFGMQINEIIHLDENAYEETTVDSIMPGWDKGIISTHTISHENKLTMIDARLKRKKLF